MVVSTRDLEFLVRRKQTADLLESFWWYDEIIGRRTGRLDRHLHLRQPMAVRRHHAHRLRLELPEHSIEDGSTLLRAHGEGGVRDELLEITRPDSPAFVEPNRREARKLIAGKPEDLEVRPPTVERHSLLPG